MNNSNKTAKEAIKLKVAEAGGPHLEKPLAGPHVADYMKYLLMLNEITKDGNEKLFDKYVQGLLAEKSYEDAASLTVDDLIKLDFSENLIAERLNAISNQTPEIRDVVEAYIGKFDSKSVLEKAGYDNSKLPDHFQSDVKTIMAYEASFPEDNKPSLSQRLAGVKDSVLNVLAKDHSRMALSATMVAVACTVGGPVGIALSGANMAKTFLQSDKVVNLLNKGHKKLNDALVKLGVKKEVIKKKENLLGNKLKAFFDNKYVKGTMAVAGVAALSFGVATITAPYIEDGTISNIAGNTAESLSSNFESIKEYASSIDTNLIEQVIDNAGSGINDGFHATKDYVEAFNVDTDKIGQVFDTAGSSISGGFNEATEVVGNIGGWFDERFDGIMDLVSDDMKQLEAESESVASQSADFTAEELGDKEIVIIKDGDRLLDIAKEKLTEAFGTEPTEQQMAQLVNDLGLENPNEIKANQEIPFPKDLSSYKEVTSIQNMDWLHEPTPIENGSFSLADDYDIERIMASTGTTSSLAELSRLNGGIDIHNLSPGDVIKLETESGIIEHSVPEVDDSIITAVFPSGVPEFLDTDKFIEMIKESNPNIDLSSGLFGNGELGKDILRIDSLVIPEVNWSELEPQNKTFILDANNIHSTREVNNTLLSVAFPNGVPELVDEKLVLESIKKGNPGLEALIKSSRGFEEVITIGEKSIDLSVSESSSKDTVANKTLFEKGSNESFMDRVREKTNGSEFAV